MTDTWELGISKERIRISAKELPHFQTVTKIELSD
jgi:hypothetical protein